MAAGRRTAGHAPAASSALAGTAPQGERPIRQAPADRRAPEAAAAQARPPRRFPRRRPTLQRPRGSAQKTAGLKDRPRSDRRSRANTTTSGRSISPNELSNSATIWREKARSLSPAEKERALAEYAFVEGRLSFWLAYEYTPPTARGNLLSAAQFLFQGAMLSGIGEPGHLPKSMLDVAADVWANDNPPLRPRFRPIRRSKSRPRRRLA